jgi:hypothetical protein
MFLRPTSLNIPCGNKMSVRSTLLPNQMHRSFTSNKVFWQKHVHFRFFSTENVKVSPESPPKKFSSYQHGNSWLMFFILGIGGALIVKKLLEDPVNSDSDLMNSVQDPIETANQEATLPGVYRHTLKNELLEKLKTFSSEEVKVLFEERGLEFIFDGDYRSSVLELALVEIDFALPNESLLFLFKYYIEHSQKAKATGMNMLHLIAKNGGHFSQLESLTLSIVQKNPELLTKRMEFGHLHLTPSELAMRTSYNEQCIVFMIIQLQEKCGLTAEDKERILSHASWLSSSIDDENRQMSERIVKLLEELSVVAA